MVDPDTLVDELAQSLKDEGWSWSRNRAGLSFMGKRLGSDRRKKSQITIRIGVKGRGRGSRKNSWPNGRLSIHFYAASLISNDRWRSHYIGGVARSLLRGFWEKYKTDSFDLLFVSGIDPKEAQQAKDWILDHASLLVGQGQEVAHQVEWLYEEDRLDGPSRSILIGQ